MDRNAFWSLIEAARSISPCNESMLEAVKARLLALTPAEIIAYQEHFHACKHQLYTWDIWGAAFVMNGGCGDDSFEYWRGMLISLGKRAFDTALNDPDSLADLTFEGEAAEGDWDFEDFLYVAYEAYEEKTGEEMPELDLPVDAEPSGEAWEEDEVFNRHPKLDKRFG